MVKIDERNIFTYLIRGSFLLTGILAATGLFSSLKFAASATVGGLLAIVNFLWLRNILQRSLQLQPVKASQFAVMRFVIRLALLGLIIFLLITCFGIDIFGLILGLSVLVINIIIISIYMVTLKGG